MDYFQFNITAMIKPDTLEEVLTCLDEIKNNLDNVNAILDHVLKSN